MKSEAAGVLVVLIPVLFAVENWEDETNALLFQWDDEGLLLEDFIIFELSQELFCY